jgi:hypothetical protein
MRFALHRRKVADERFFIGINTLATGRLAPIDREVLELA